MESKIMPLFIVLALMVLAGCGNKTNEEQVLLKADREAPLGWVYLKIYRDSTFEFTSAGIRRSDKNVYTGKVEIRDDSLFFTYADSIPKAGKTAVYNDSSVHYIDGEYPEQLAVSWTKLTR